MVEITRARSQGARALTAAIFTGSAAGGALGAAYLTAVRPMHVAQPVVAAVATPATAVLPSAPAPGQTASATTPARPEVHVVSLPPFRFAAVARGSSDLKCLTEAVYFEARGEPEQGQQAVAQVVLNRVRHPAFPKTICAVVHQRTSAGCQFSFACSPEPRGRDETAWARAEDVSRSALHGAVMREVGDATHFESVRAAAFAGLLKVARIGEHVFYRFGGHGGAAGMFHQTPAPSAPTQTSPPPRILLASLSTSAAPALAQAPAEKSLLPVPPSKLAVAVAAPAAGTAKPAAAAPARAGVAAPAAAVAVPAPPSATLTSATVKTAAPSNATVAS